MNNTFFDGHDEQSLGKIVQRAPAVGAKMWCLFAPSLGFWSVISFAYALIDASVDFAIVQK